MWHKGILRYNKTKMNLREADILGREADISACEVILSIGPASLFSALASLRIVFSGKAPSS